MARGQGVVVNSEIITLQSLGILSLYSLLGLFIFAAGGAPFWALIGERLAVAQKRVFLDKLGGQLAAMAGILALCTIPFSLGAWFMSWGGEWVTLYFQDATLPLPEISLQLVGVTNMINGGLYALALALVLLYWFSWKPMRKSKPAHSFFGLLATLACLAALLMALGVKRASMAPSDTAFTLEQTMGTLIGFLATLPLRSAFWPLVAESVAVCATAGAAIGLLYLLSRRSKEDFGRDYYTFALKKLAAWALSAVALTLFMGGWLAMALLPEARSLDTLPQLCNNPVFLVFVPGLLCLLLACICWNLVERSDTPLRHKPAVVLGACFLWLGFTLQGVGVYLATA